MVGLLVASYDTDQERDFGVGVVNTQLTTRDSQEFRHNSHATDKGDFMNYLSEVVLKRFFCAFADQDTWHNRLLSQKGAKKMYGNGIRNNWHVTLQVKGVKYVAWAPS